MPFFRKKPVVIEAFQIVDATQLVEGAPKWWLIATMKGDDEEGYVRHGVDCWRIHTMEGVMTAVDGDWIIRGVRGELYPCKPEIFAATYEAADNPSDNSRGVEGS